MAGMVCEFTGKVKGVYIRAIISEDDFGFVNVEYFDDPDEFINRWNGIKYDYDALDL